jgi:aspartate racemase
MPHALCPLPFALCPLPSALRPLPFAIKMNIFVLQKQSIMKKPGLIGGLGPEATMDYYKEIINAFKKDSTDFNYPELIIYSVNMSEFLGMMKKKEYDKIVGLITGKIAELKAAGCDFVAMTANTPHLLFNEINKASPLPLISIVEACFDETNRRGFRRPGLFGTSFTMESNFYQEVFNKNGIEIILPEPSDREWLNNKLFTEIELGIYREDTREGLIQLISKMAARQNIDSIILGCTEFPIILSEKSYGGIPVLDTTRIHVDAIVKQIG